MKNELKGLNIPDMSVSAVIRLLSDLYENALKKDLPLKALPTPFFWGAAGSGKSEGVYQLADEIAARTGKKVIVTEVRLLLFAPTDLRGIPVADAEKRFSNWLMPRIFQMNPGKDQVNLLFLDELSAATQSVQAAAYQLCLDRKVGEFTLPENCIVIAAGNRTTDQSVSYKMPKALCNRLMHFNISCDYEDWRRWAVQHGVAQEVIAFLGLDSSRLSVEPESSDLAYATPRSWTFVSTLISTLEGPIESIHPLIAACVGSDAALEFEAFCKGCLHMPPIKDVLSGKCRELPRSHDIMYAMVSAFVSLLQREGDRLTESELDNLCSYLVRFPKDFVVTFLKDATAIPEMDHLLMRCFSLQSWLSKHKFAL